MNLVELTDETSIEIKNMLELDPQVENVKMYNMDTGSKVIYCTENGKEHVSISNTKRLPRWDEIKYVRYKLMKPDIHVAQILPPREEYVNVHENCFHLWELDRNEFDKKGDKYDTNK